MLEHGEATPDRVWARVLAIIPARGGSKGIPRKNLAMVGRHPLVGHSILHAKGCPEVGGVVVSTDDAEIAAVSRGFGAEVIERPAEIAGDRSSSESALIHVLDERVASGFEDPEIVVMLQATSPLRAAGDIAAALRPVLDGDVDSVFSACEFDGLVWGIEPGGPVPLNYDPVTRQMRQDMPRRVLENGSIYAVRTPLLRETGCRVAGRIGVHVMPREDSVQVDDPGDLVLCDALLAARRAGGEPGMEAVA